MNTKYMLVVLHVSLPPLTPPHVPPAGDGGSIESHDQLEHSPVADILGAHTRTVNRCTRCLHEIHKDTTSLLLNMTYPDYLPGEEGTY